MGNTEGTGGSAPTGGSDPTGGSGTTGGGGTAGAIEPMSGGGAGRAGSGGTTCSSADFAVTSSLSTTIPTVGIVDWSFRGPMTEAHIDFGRTAGTWEFRAPVTNPSAGSQRTLLLGMKALTTYSYQVVVTSSGTPCASETGTITTGRLGAGLPTITLDTPRPGEVYEGFTMSCQPDGQNPGVAFIFDQDGEIVWWFRGTATSDCTQVAMSYDGQYLFMGSLNMGLAGGGRLARVTMDGVGEESYDVPDLHHDFCIGPDGKIAYLEYDDRGCDNVKELDPETGVATQVYAMADANPAQADDCHSNAINWWPAENLYTVSALYWNAIAAFSRNGQLAWLIGGDSPTISGASWNRQHNHDLTSANSLLVFSNEGSGASSVVREYEWIGDSATEIWSYSGGLQSNTLGDVKRLPNGNTLVTYSNLGVIHEVNASGQLVQSIDARYLGYVIRRTTLYGPPPPWVR